jgi:hypothetical protein
MANTAGRMFVWTDFRMANLMGLEEHLGWKGYHLTGLTVKADDEGFFIVLKATHKGQKVVHFTGGRTFSDALENLGFEVHEELLSWRPDKY